jgi:purine catabolism regulator
VSPPQSAFTLGDLLAQEHLGLELMAGGDEALGRRLEGAHAIEIDRPSTWLEPGWIMLTTGVRLRNNAAGQRRLIGELQAADAAAVGFGLDIVFKRVPAALLREAQAREFPVFSVPLPTPFREVISIINRALASSDLRALQRLSSMQLYLMDALGEDDPEGAVVERLAAFVDATVLLLAPDGTVQTATGEAPAEAIWQAIADKPAALVEFQADGWHTIALPVAAGQGPTQWLALTSRRGRWATRLTRPAARATAPVLAALARLGGMARDQERAVRASLLEQLLGPVAGREAAALSARAASLGIDFVEPARVVLVRRHHAANGAGRLDLDEACRRLEQMLGRDRLPHLAGRRAGAAVALVQGDHARVRAAVEALVEGEPRIAVGIGRAARAAQAISHSLRDAEIAIQRLTQDRHGRLLDFDDFDLATLVVSEAPSERIEPKVEQLMSVLRANPALHEAVVAYFQYGMDAMRAARAMGLHHNSLRYRLGRVEQFLGRPLKDPATIASLYIALAAAPPDPVPEDAPAAR